MPRHLTSDAHEWINEVPSVPIFIILTQLEMDKIIYFLFFFVFLGVFCFFFGPWGGGIWDVGSFLLFASMGGMKIHI